MDRKRVFIHSEDADLAVHLVKLLDKHGVTAFWLSQEEGENWSSSGGGTPASGRCMGTARWPSGDSRRREVPDDVVPGEVFAAGDSHGLIPLGALRRRGLFGVVVCPRLTFHGKDRGFYGSFSYELSLFEADPSPDPAGRYRLG